MEKWQVYAGTAPRNTHKEVDSLKSCAEYCSDELDWCDGFNFLANNSKGKSNCFPREGAKLRAQDNTATELKFAGWCPNNKGD